MTTTSEQAVRERVQRLADWHQRGFERAVAVTQDFTGMVGALSPEQLDTVVPGLEWRVRDVVAHVDSVCRRYTVNGERAVDRADVAAKNAFDLEATDLSVEEMLEDMAGQLASLDEVIGLVDPSHRFDFHAGETITMAGGWGNLIGEMLAHGDDIARAAGVDWTVSPSDLEPLWRYATEALGSWLSDEGCRVDELWELDLGFASGPVLLELAGGSVVVDPITDRVADHVITGDATDVTLAVPYRRRSPSTPELATFADRFEPL